MCQFGLTGQAKTRQGRVGAKSFDTGISRLNDTLSHTTYHVNPLLCVQNYTLPRFNGRRTLSCLPLGHLVQNPPEETVR